MFNEITMIDYARPLAERRESRKICGPYLWRPSRPGSGRGFYCGAAEDIVGDSTFRLRLRLAHEVLPHKRERGFYTSHDGGETIQPIVARLPHKRGFMAGWTMGANMCATLGPELYEDEQEAAHAAYGEAEYAAGEELAREYDDDDDDREAA